MDVGATLRPCEVEVQLGQWIYTVPALPASRWIEAIADDSLGSVVPGLLDVEDQRLVMKAFLLGEVDPEEFNQAWREVLGVVTGRPWWEGARLVLEAVKPDVWPIVHGRFSQRGMDLEAISIGAFCNAVFVMALESATDEKERSKFIYDLALPPPGVGASEADAALDSGDDFLAAMRAMQGLMG